MDWLPTVLPMALAVEVEVLLALGMTRTDALAVALVPSSEAAVEEVSPVAVMVKAAVADSRSLQQEEL